MFMKVTLNITYEEYIRKKENVRINELFSKFLVVYR